MDAAARSQPRRDLGLKAYVKNGDLLTLAEFARSKLGKHEYVTLLKKIFDKPLPPQNVHKLIARTDYRAVVTTNYDRLIETTFTFERGTAPSTFTSDSIGAMATAFWTPDAFVFKLHGDTNFPESLILTAQDYDRSILRVPHLRSFLQSVFINYTVFFVGYSLSDPDFQVLLKELTAIFQGYTPQHYALIPNPQEFTTDYLQKSMNIQAMVYDPKDGHAIVEKVLNELQKVAPFKKPKFYAQSEAHAPMVVREDASGKKYGRRKTKHQKI
ncbi:MAG: SIR2 family NAD-dependent protein deacylase [bacterium]